MKIERRSPFTGRVHTMEIDITPEQLAAYEKGGILVQDAFPHLSPVEREFIYSGMTSEEWDRAINMGHEDNKE